VTLRAFTGDSFPRRLHSEHDSRDRLSVAAIERSALLLEAMVERADRAPFEATGSYFGAGLAGDGVFGMRSR
jgi:hypothetical protein